MLDAAAKINDPAGKSYFYVRTKNGTIYELDTVDDIFSLDNIGEKLIVFLHFSVGNTDFKNKSNVLSNGQEWSISIGFENQSFDRDHEYPTIQLQVLGRSRDWVILAAGELEERIKLTQRFSITRYTSHVLAPYIATFLVFGILTAALMTTPEPESAHLQLEHLRKSGQIKDAIDAIIAVEKIHDPQNKQSQGLGQHSCHTILHCCHNVISAQASSDRRQPLCISLGGVHGGASTQKNHRVDYMGRYSTWNYC
jgi:hypothetical protein